MKMTILLIFAFWVNACQLNSQPISKSAENSQPVNVENTFVNSSVKTNVTPDSAEPESTSTQTNQPKTVREFFTLLPQKYFRLEGCEAKTDKNCEKARKEYLKTFLEIEDNKNGYWKSGCDGGQSCLTMAIFKRPDATYIVHILTEFEAGEDSYFLEYKDGKWNDISASVVPEFSQKNTYVPPRQGTTVEVFKKNFPEPNFSERGEKLYDLVWQNGKFAKKN
jgi:hypothetical protein